MTTKEIIIEIPNQRSKIKWTSYLATAYAEDFCEGENATPEQQIEAWAVLIKTGLCNSLQGWFGRTAQDLIIKEYIDKNGVINWEYIDEL